MIDDQFLKNLLKSARSSVLDFARKHRIPIVVLFGAIVGGWVWYSYWQDRLKSPISATFTLEDVSVPTSWKVGSKNARIQLLQIHVRNASGKRQEVQEVVIAPVKELLGIGSRTFDRRDAPTWTWEIEQHKSDAYQVARLRAKALIGPDSGGLVMSLWGSFGTIDYLDVVLDVGDIRIAARAEETYPRLIVLLWESAVPLLLIAVGAVLSGFLIFVDKQERK